jgi:integrase
MTQPTGVETAVQHVTLTRSLRRCQGEITRDASHEPAPVQGLYRKRGVQLRQDREHRCIAYELLSRDRWQGQEDLLHWGRHLPQLQPGSVGSLVADAGPTQHMPYLLLPLGGPLAGVGVEVPADPPGHPREACSVKTIGHLTVEVVNAFLDRCRADGIIKTNQTRKHHERAIKAFTRWAYATERLDRDILARLDVTYVDQERDVVHTRSEFTLEEISRISGAATGATPLAGLTGRQRALLYAFAASTGFRARECAAIRRQDFTDDFGFVILSGLFTKNRKRATLPIPPSLREVLAEYAAKLAPDAFLWPGGWQQNQKKEWVPAGWIKDSRAGEFLRADAALVGIVIGRKGKESNGGRVLDFHSFRHTYISNLERADVTDGLRGQLSRATAQEVERYTHRELGRLSEVAERLPTPDLSALKWPA